MTTPAAGTPEPTKDKLQDDIEATRAELGETIDLLSRKLDVKTRVKESAADGGRRAVEQAKAKPAVSIAATAAVVVVAALVIWRRRR